MIKVSDYIVQRLPLLTGSRHCFYLSGGGIMHLCESLGRSTELSPIAMHHEQAAAIAADAYGRFGNTVGIVLTTTGPGATNALTGVSGAFLDSTPLLAISGQVSRATWKQADPVRQLGFQEIDIVSIVKSFTKYAVTLAEPMDVRYHLEKAVWAARTGRPGPVWLDIPLDVQAALVNADDLRPFIPTQDKETQVDPPLNDILIVSKLLKESRRPLLVVGHGVWLSGGKQGLRKLVDKLQIPVQTSWNGADLIPESHPLYFGRHNSYGPRYPNIIVQNCDLILSLGCRLGIQQIGYNWKQFAPMAKKIMVDIDPSEIAKRTLQIDLPIACDAHSFIKAMNQVEYTSINRTAWIQWCSDVRSKYPYITKDYLMDKFVDPHVFIDTLSDLCPNHAVIVPGSSGTGFSVANKQFKIKEGQRFFSSKGHAAMGYGVPSSLGACIASGGRLTITIVGDGGLMLNVQELQTISHHKLPIIIFVFNNRGYFSIRMTQKAYFGGHYVGSDEASGVSIPKIADLAKAFSLSYEIVENHSELKRKLPMILLGKMPILVEIMLTPEKPLLPKLSSRRREDGTMESLPLDDMEPFLPKEELDELRNSCLKLM
jgi:acetolactate synthase-1/2/3 large subunit